MAEEDIHEEARAFVIAPRDEHLRTIIALHGRGSTGEEFAEEIFESRFSSGETLRDLLPGYKWVFPTCRPRFATAFQENITQWYEIRSLTDPESSSESQIEGIRDSIVQIQGLVEQELTKSSTREVVLLGISQGFTIATLVALIGTPGLKATLGFSSWLPFSSDIARELGRSKCVTDTRREAGKVLAQRIECSPLLGTDFPGLPVYLAHCSDDNVVDVSLGHQLKDTLVALGHRLTWCETPLGGHWINEPRGMDQLKAFLCLHGLVTI